MDPMLSSETEGKRSEHIALAPTRCSICRQRLGGTVHYIEETGQVPEPRQTWAICPECDTAVRAEVERSPVRSSLRLRVAVGLVAAERTPAGRRHAWGGRLSDDQWLRLLMWGFILGFIVHTIVMIVIARMVFGS